MIGAAPNLGGGLGATCPECPCVYLAYCDPKYLPRCTNDGEELCKCCCGGVTGGTGNGGGGCGCSGGNGGGGHTVLMDAPSQCYNLDQPGALRSLPMVAEAPIGGGGGGGGTGTGNCSPPVGLILPPLVPDSGAAFQSVMSVSAV